MCKKSLKDQIGVLKFFEDVSNQIVKLENEKLELNGYSIYIKLFAVKADNKAANEMIVDISNNFTQMIG